MSTKEVKGRQKIKMAKIKNPNHRQVTFSKRRLGLFKKASEICTLCGVEATIIVFSPGQKIFSFGQPDVDAIVDRFLSRNSHPQVESDSNKQKGIQKCSNIRELNAQLTQMLDLLETEKSRGEVLTNLRLCNHNQWWWEAPINKLGLDELEVLSASMQDLKKIISNHAMLLMETNDSSFFTMGADGGHVSPHLDLKTIEAKVGGFFRLPQQVDNFHAQQYQFP